MDGVSGIIAVISFSIQLVETVQKANKFLKEVRNAPEEVIKLVGTLDELEALLVAVDGLVKRQSSMGNHLNSIDMIERALRHCRSTTTTLDTCVNTMKAYFDRQGRLHKAWASIRSIGKKDDVERLRKQVEGDMSDLRTALNINMSHLQLHQIELVTHPPLQDTSIQHEQANTCLSVRNFAQPRGLVASSKTSTLKTNETEIWRYQTPVGIIGLRKKYRSLRAKGHGPETALSEESCLTFVPYLLCTAFELRSCDGFFQVPRSLSVFPVIQDSWTFQEWCFPENIEAFKYALTRRELSPYSRNTLGRTFLHEAVFWDNPELCSILIQLGVDVNHRNDFGDIALQGLCWGNTCHAGIARSLMNAYCDIELEDLYLIFENYYYGSPEVAEFLLSACNLSIEADLANTPSFTFLTIALREFGRGMNKWEPWIRRLLHCKKDVHASKLWSQDDISLGSLHHTYTALDDLFENTDCPFEAKRVAQDWLQMLTEAGFNVKDYLEKERSLHRGQNYLTRPVGYDFKRQLVFKSDGNPSVGWEWWFHPLSSGSLVCHEFRNMNPTHIIYSVYTPTGPLDLWENTWPYNYPKWSDDYRETVSEPPLRLNATEVQEWQEWQEKDLESWEKMRKNVARRHARQTRKKYPQYYGELNRPPPIPGAWVGG